MDPHSFIARAEAQRWLGIAEKLLISHDLVGSKTFAIRARESDPRLEPADQILAIADTLLAAEKRVVGNNGSHQPDYYAILQLVRFVQDTEHVASQYRRLAVLLNPHQNRFPYADQAFQLVNDAWAVLSNPMRKSMYDSDLDYPPQQQMTNLGFNLEQQQQQQQQQHHQQQHHQQQQQPHNFFSISQDLPEQPQGFQSRIHQQQQQQQLQQHNFLSQPNPVRPTPQEHMFQHREQDHLFQTQVQPFQVTSPPHQQSRPSPQPHIQSPPATPQSPFSWQQGGQQSQSQFQHHQMKQEQQHHQHQIKQEQQHHQHEQQLQQQLKQEQLKQQQQQQEQLKQLKQQQFLQQQKIMQEEQRKQQQMQEEQRKQQQMQEEQRKQQQLLEEQQRKQQQLLEEQRKQQQLQEEQRKQQQLIEEQRKQQQLLEEQRKQQLLEEQRKQQQLQEEQQQLLEEQRKQQQLLEEQRKQQQLLEEQQRQQQLQEEQRKHQQLQEEQRKQESLKQNAAPVQNNTNNGVRDEETETELEPEPEPDDDSPTFWTACPYCFYMYEYPKLYVECTLRCDHCKRAFQAVRIASPPPIIEGQDAYFYCWGFFPLGLSMSHLQNNKGTPSSNWTPFSSLHTTSNNKQNHLNEQAAPKQNPFVNKSSGPRIYIDDITDDVFIGGVSEPSSDSDIEWKSVKKQKLKKMDKGFKERIQVLALRAMYNTVNASVNNVKDGVEVPTVLVVETNKKHVGGNPRKQSKLDLNVAAGTRVREQGEEDNVEGIEFFEGLDDYLSNLPILSVVNDDKVTVA